MQLGLLVLALCQASFDAPALRAEVLTLCEETRDVVVAQGHVEAVRLHGRFTRFCEDQQANATHHAREVLDKACGAEALSWDTRERLRGEEVRLFATVLSLLRSDAAPSLVQSAGRQSGLRGRQSRSQAAETSDGGDTAANRTAAEQARICDVDVSKLSLLRSALERKVNQTANATAVLKDTLDTKSETLVQMKKTARAAQDKAGSLEAGYADQEALVAASATHEQGTSRAVHLAVDMVANFYAQRHASLPAEPDLEELGDEQTLSELQAVWPAAPPAPPPYAFHRDYGSDVVSVLRSYASILDDQAHGTHEVEEAMRGEARRVRGFKTSQAHNAREQLAKLKLEIKDDDQALVALRERLHTEQGELSSVDEKLGQLSAVCDKLRALPNATTAEHSE